MSALDFSPRRVVRNSGNRLVSFVAGQGAKALVAVVVARALGAEAFGTFAVVWMVAGIVAYLAPAGVDTLLIRELSRARPRVDLRIAIPLTATVGLLAAGLFVGGVALVAAERSTVLAVIAAAPFVALTGPVQIMNATFSARERMELEALTEALDGIVTLALATWVLSAGGGVASVLGAMSVGRVVNLIVAAVVHRRLPPLPRAAGDLRWVAVLRTSAPMASVRALQLALQRADVVILGLFVATEQVGIYSAAAIVVATSTDALSEIGRAAYPAFARAWDTSARQLRGAYGTVWRMQTLVAVTALAGLVAVGPDLLPEVFGAEFRAGTPVLIALAFAVPLRSMANLGGVALYAVDRQWRRVGVVGIVAAVKVTLALSLVPPFGLWGAVAATLVADLAYFTVMATATRAQRPPLPTGLGLAVVVALGVGVVAWITPGGLIVEVVAGVAVAAVVSTTMPVRRLLHDAWDVAHDPGATVAVNGMRQAGPVAVAVEAEPDLARSLVVRAFDYLPRVTADTDASLTVHWRTGVDVTGLRVHGHPLRVDHGAILAVDHAGHAARMTFDGQDQVDVELDPRLDVHVFQTWVQLPLMRTLLFAHGGTLARLTVVEYDGRRIALVAPSAVGKTRVVVELLRHGATLVGDDWVALTADGVAAACPLMVVRDQVRHSLAADVATDGRDVTVQTLAGLSRFARRWRRAAVVLDQLATAAWRWGAEVTDVGTVIPGAGLADGTAPIAQVVVLGDGAAPTIDELAATIAGRAVVDLPSAAVLVATRAASSPGVDPPRLPTLEEDRVLIAAALARARIDPVAFDGTASALERVIATIQASAPTTTEGDRP